MVEPVDQPDEVSFGRWRVTDARPKSLLAKNTIVEVRFTPTSLILGDNAGQALDAWSLDQVAFAVYGNSDGYLRLGSDGLWIKSTEHRRSRELREAINERRPPDAPIAGDELPTGPPARRTGAPSWLAFGCVFTVFGAIALIVWLWVAFSNYSSTTGESSGGMAAAGLAAAIVVAVGLLLALAAGGFFSPSDKA